MADPQNIASSREYLIPIVKRYFNDDVETAAHNIESLSASDAASLFQEVPTSLAASIFNHISAETAAAIIKELPSREIVRICEKLRPETTTALFVELNTEEQTSFLNSVSPQLRTAIEEHLTFPEDSAGRVMKTDYFALTAKRTVKDAI